MKQSGLCGFWNNFCDNYILVMNERMNVGRMDENIGHFIYAPV